MDKDGLCYYTKVHLTAPYGVYMRSINTPVTQNVTRLDPELKQIYVFCGQGEFSLQLYYNFHLITMKRPDILKKIKKSRKKKTSKDPNLGIIFLQVDSTSLSSFRRGMPSVAKYLDTSGWFTFLGHHKVCLNTLVNAHAIFQGKPDYYYGDSYFKDFRANDYVTAYGEDMSSETLVYYKNPADFKSLPTKLGLEMLPPTFWINYYMCNGPYSVLNTVYDQLMDFATTFQGERYAGVFVVSTYTHDDVSGISGIELPFLKYMKQLERQGVWNNSAIILYADHGQRFGYHRPQFEAAREDAMPMLWIWLPKWFRQNNPNIVKALQVNKWRLSSQYDIYHTWKHLIVLNGGKVERPRAPNCPKCQSLFKELPVRRHCQDAGIPYNYCFCNAHKTVGKNQFKKEKQWALETAVKYMNKFVNRMGSKCLKIRDPVLIRGWKVENAITVVFTVNQQSHVYQAVVLNRGNRIPLVDVLPLTTYSNWEACSPRKFIPFCFCEVQPHEDGEDALSSESRKEVKMLRSGSVVVTNLWIIIWSFAAMF